MAPSPEIVDVTILNSVPDSCLAGEVSSCGAPHYPQRYVMESASPQAFFARLVRYTMMGFYGDPRHGGNRQHVSWRMLGVSPVPIRGRLHEVPVATPTLKKKEG